MRTASRTLLAVSLAELIVSMGLLGILMVASDIAFRHGLAHQKRLTEIAQMESDALAAIKHLSNTVREVNLDRIELVDDPGPGPLLRDALITPYFRDAEGRVLYTDQGNLAWAHVICFQLQDRGDETWLIRETGDLPEEFAFPPVLSRIDPPIGMTFFLTQDLPTRILHRSVRSFQVDKVPASETIAIRLKVGKEVNNRLYEYTIAESFAPRN